jgi:hypothetical protein
MVLDDTMNGELEKMEESDCGITEVLNLLAFI